jgi:hypothetical protein
VDGYVGSLYRSGNMHGAVCNGLTRQKEDGGVKQYGCKPLVIKGEGNVLGSCSK